MNRVIKWVAITILSIGFVAPFFLIWIGHNQLHDAEIPNQKTLVKDHGIKVLAFFPHPDDEVTVSGTLMSLLNQGNEVYLVTLTKGEAGNSGEQYSKSELALLRTTEMQRAANIIGVTKLHLLDYPDSGLENLGMDSLKRIAKTWIDEIQPDILISYDSKVGLYGHPDHRLSGLAIEEVFVENYGSKGFSPERLFQVTLSPKQIEIALKISSSFQKNYPKDKSKGLPYPSFSVYTQPYFEQVLAVMQSHETQQKVLKDLMPYHDQIPIWIYSRVFDREYFYEVR